MTLPDYDVEGWGLYGESPGTIAAALRRAHANGLREAASMTSWLDARPIKRRAEAMELGSE